MLQQGDDLMNLINFNKISAIAMIVGITVCAVPKSAQAGLLQYSGSPNAGETFIKFQLDNNVPDSQGYPSNTGLFVGAIQDARYSCIPESISLCNGKQRIRFQPGNITASSITSLNDIKNYPGDNSYIGGVKYEVRLNSKNSSDFLEFGILVKPSQVNTVNSLSVLTPSVLKSSDTYVGVRSLNSQNGFFIGAGSNFTAVSHQ